MVAALIGAFSGLFVVLMGLLITMVFGLFRKVDSLRASLTLKVDNTDYKEEIKTIKVKLEGQCHKLLKLQIIAKVEDDEDC